MIVHVEMYFHALKNSAGACILFCIYPQSPALDCLRLPGGANKMATPDSRLNIHVSVNECRILWYK